MEKSKSVEKISRIISNSMDAFSKSDDNIIVLPKIINTESDEILVPMVVDGNKILVTIKSN